MSLNPALGSYYQTSDSSIDEIKQKKPKESWSLQTPDLIKTGTQHTGDQDSTDDQLNMNTSTDDMIPIITDELNPSLRNRIIRVIKDFVLFPTRVRVIASGFTLVWLAYCWSMITFGLTNDHYCPAEPNLSNSIALHGVFWVVVCCYVIVRLIWTEVMPDKQPTCSFKVGNPSVALRWKKEYSFGFDSVVLLLLLTSYIYNMIYLVRLLEKKPYLVHAPHRQWLTTCKQKSQTDNCCRRFLVEYAISQQVISYIGIALLSICYLYIMGFISFLQSRICFKRFNADQAETVPLV